MEIRETGIFEAKTHLSELVQKVQEEGVTYCITKRGKPVAELRPVARAAKRLPFGYGKSTVLHMSKDFDAPLEDFKDYQ